METIHIFLGRDGVDDALLVDMFGEGQLDQNSVHAGVFVALANDSKQFVLRGRLGQGDEFAVEAAVLGCFDFAADIGHAGGVLAHENNVETRFAAVLRGEDSYLLANLFFEVLCYLFAVYNHNAQCAISVL